MDHGSVIRDRPTALTPGARGTAGGDSLVSPLEPKRIRGGKAGSLKAR
jgi:hypothetical protein